MPLFNLKLPGREDQLIQSALGAHPSPEEVKFQFGFSGESMFDYDRDILYAAQARKEQAAQKQEQKKKAAEGEEEEEKKDASSSESAESEEIELDEIWL